MSLLLSVALLCAAVQQEGLYDGMTSQLCVGAHAGKLWLVSQSPFRSYVPEVMFQPGTRCLRVPSGPFQFTTGEVSFPP